jgi:hypothetical protein
VDHIEKACALMMLSAILSASLAWIVSMGLDVL